MKKLGFSQTDGKRWDEILASIRYHQPDEIYLFGETEWQYEIPTMIVKICKAFGIRIKIVHGAVNNRYYQEFYRLHEGGYIKSEDVEFWPTFWIHWATHCLGTDFNYKKYYPDPENFKYHFITLNNKGHTHRAALIDHLFKYDLLDKGIVTWNKFIYDGSNYSWDYYDNSPLYIDDNFYSIQDSFLIPKQYHESLFHIAGEATDNLIFITEKTVLPMLHKKPVIAFGGTGINTYLKELGFELFDELIDYRFDAIFDVKQRADALASEIFKLTQRKESLSELYQMIKPKIDHNFNRIQEIIHDPNTIPKIVKEFVEYNIQMNTPLIHSFGRFPIFMQNCNLIEKTYPDDQRN